MALRTCAGAGHWYTSPPARGGGGASASSAARPDTSGRGMGPRGARLARAALRSSGEPGRSQPPLAKIFACVLGSNSRRCSTKIGHAMLCSSRRAMLCSSRHAARALCRCPAPARRALCAAPAPAPAAAPASSASRLVSLSLRAARGLTLATGACSLAALFGFVTPYVGRRAPLTSEERDALFREAGALAGGGDDGLPLSLERALEAARELRAPPLSFRDLQRAPLFGAFVWGTRAARSRCTRTRAVRPRAVGSGAVGDEAESIPFPFPPPRRRLPPFSLWYADATGRLGRAGARASRCRNKLIDAALGDEAARPRRARGAPARGRRARRALGPRRGGAFRAIGRTATARSTRTSSWPRCCSCSRPRRARRARARRACARRVPHRRRGRRRPRRRRELGVGRARARAPRAARRRRPRADTPPFGLFGTRALSPRRLARKWLRRAAPTATGISLPRSSTSAGEAARARARSPG